MDELEEKAKEAVKKDVERKNINDIGRELKERFPDKSFPGWLKQFIFMYVYQRQTYTAASEVLNISRNTIRKHIDEDVKLYMEDLKTLQIHQYDQKIYNLVEKSIQALEDIVNSADSDATRLRAAEDVLKQFGLLSDKREIEHSGSIGTYQVEFTDEPTEDEDE